MRNSLSAQSIPAKNILQSPFANMVSERFSQPYRGLLSACSARRPYRGWRKRQHTIEDQIVLNQEEGQSAGGDRVTRRGGPLSPLTKGVSV